MKKILSILAALLLLLAARAGNAEELKDYYSLFQAAKEAGDEGAMARIRSEMPQGLYPFKDGETGLWGYIDASGNEAIPLGYLEAGAFKNGCADVRDARNGWRIISADGSVLFFRDDLAEFDDFLSR